MFLLFLPIQQELKVTARVTQGEKKETMLEEMRDRVTTEEIGLEKVLYTDSKELRNQFPDADKLLSQVSNICRC